MIVGYGFLGLWCQILTPSTQGWTFIFYRQKVTIF
jgi:hypothetical protein